MPSQKLVVELHTVWKYHKSKTKITISLWFTSSYFAYCTESMETSSRACSCADWRSCYLSSTDWFLWMFKIWWTENLLNIIFFFFSFRSRLVCRVQIGLMNVVLMDSSASNPSTALSASPECIWKESKQKYGISHCNLPDVGERSSQTRMPLPFCHWPLAKVVNGSMSGWRSGMSGFPRGQYWSSFSSISSPVTLTVGSSAPSASLWMTPSCGVWSTQPRDGVPSWRTWTGWAVGPGEPHEVQQIQMQDLAPGSRQHPLPM